MYKAGLIVVAALSLQSLTAKANDISHVIVNGWANDCDAACQRSLTVYTKDAQELDNTIDLSNVAITGKKPINDYEMVNVADEMWVENDVVNIEYCETKVAKVATTTTKRSTSSAMGSGEGCDQ